MTGLELELEWCDHFPIDSDRGPNNRGKQEEQRQENDPLQARHGLLRRKQQLFKRLPVRFFQLISQIQHGKRSPKNIAYSFKNLFGVPNRSIRRLDMVGGG